MKNFYLLIILLVSGFGFAQNARIGEYEVKTVLNIKAGSGSYSSSCRNDVKVDLIYNDGTITIINENIGGIPSDRYTLYEKTINVLATRKPVKVQVYSSRNWKRKVGGCGGKGSFNGDKRESTQFFSCLNNYTDIVRWWDDKLSITNNPILTIINPKDDSFPTDSNITIASHTGFLPSEYNWQYSLNPDPDEDLNSRSWTNLPQYNTQSSISTNAKAILGANAANFHGNKIYFRQKACNIVSKPVMYIIRQSAPFIISHNEKETTCFNSEDGKLVLKFSRPLISAEQLNYSIVDYDDEKQTWKEVMCSTQDNGGIIVDASNSFQIPCDFAKGRYKLYFIGSINGVNTNPSTNFDNPFFFEIKSPAPVDFSITSKTNILCYGVNDGAIEITATGGTANGIYQYSTNDDSTWKSFTNGNKHTITNLQKGDCTIKVRKIKDASDTIGCIAKLSGTENDKILTENISEPLVPLILNYTFKKDPTFYGAANGKLVAAISGGTINDDKSYGFEWKNSIGIVMPATAQYNSADKTYNITLENAPEGEYKLTVKDKNYNNATNKEGCSIIESSQILTQPEKIKITLQEIQPISCNTENGESDINKFSDGILKATVSGGIPFTGTANNGLPYSFIWSKYNTITGLWEELSEYKTATAENLSQGNYSLNIIDANGIVQGTYNTTDLVTAIPTTKEMVEPAKLELTFDSGNVSCHAGNNGWAQANVTGGSSPYTYTWYNTGEGIIDVNKISHLTAGTYTVEVIDAKGCFTKGSIAISEPEFPVAIEYTEIFTPTFSGATNGRIVAKITGGTPNDDKSYQYEWKNSVGVLQTTSTELKDGFYTITLNGVPADTYFLTIKDKNYNEGTTQIINCSVLESKVALTEPDPLVVTFEIKQTISCNTSNEFGNDKDTTPKDGQRDESQDGILIAHVTGGTPLASSANNGLPYYFYWKKQQADGSWTVLANITSETASNLSHGNYALNIKDRNGIMLGTYVNNVLTQEIDVTQLMQEPPKLAVTITKGDVFCNGGNDGWATANVVGGTPPYDYRWSNEVDIDENTILKAGEYWVFITDAKGCTTQESVTILQPATPLSIKYTEVLDPSFYKATNGKIVVEVTGGTIFPDNSYWFEWKNSKEIIQTTTTTSFSNGVYTISLSGIPEETYSLTVRDANYKAATNKISCTVANSITTLDDPDPLEVTFEIVRTISCNVSNEFGNETDANPQDNQRDESQDGILVAHVKGGIQLKADKNNALPYFYTWKKQQKDGSWIIWNDQDETAENVSDGTYALNIEDANGIKLGTYVNNVLVKEVDVTQYMSEPAKLNLAFTKGNASCNNGDDGWAEAHVSGGTPPYTYEWTNGETTARIENITTNNYFVIATDAKGCVVQGSIFVGDPKGIFTTETVKNPTCYSGNDGSIELNVTGGNLPYRFLWNTGATTKDLNNLVAGNYEVTISCTDCCVYKKKFILKDPNPIVVDLGKDSTLCNDQVLDLDATISDDKAQYSWSATNGFTSNQAKVSLTKAGTYTVKVTSALGCVGEDEIIIKTNQVAISSEFLLSSQAYSDEEVILINTSNPFGESTQWILPKGVSIVEQKEKYITLKFDATGIYTIGLQQTQGDCFATYNKNITVEKRSTLPNVGTMSKFITDFIVTPNPSNGNFKAIINLENNSTVNLRLFSTTGEFATQKKDSGKKKYEVDFNTSLPSGMYILVLETEQQTLVKKIIIY
ncbi:T9SS type A sorting domain-containing protein [Flavobacterium sp. 140616W15]|uniref:T9SS type A sorting domain-containing protein n=1 Tax=Flavobacterium sp. 140616W15 TaxID=2478552 RepID=UPI000F0C36F4|nr:T9SS type A sorting domain-containing protein [Flavobacterium sp. 140616W15]AYN03305.1 T9SS C-terminal target domain-containing protein [Flavobacterium sp. 140616W15]